MGSVNLGKKKYPAGVNKTIFSEIIASSTLIYAIHLLSSNSGGWYPRVVSNLMDASLRLN